MIGRLKGELLENEQALVRAREAAEAERGHAQVSASVRYSTACSLVSLGVQCPRPRGMHVNSRSGVFVA
jgi:hypothetical protein